MNYTIGIIVAAVVILGGWYLLSNNSGQMAAAPQDTATVTTTSDTAASSSTTTSGSSTGTQPVATSSSSGKVAVTVSGFNKYYDVKTINARVGDTVTVTFMNKQGLHDWNLDEFNAHSKQIQTGQTDTVTFVASKAGTYEYYCSVGDHRAMGMVGKLIVQ